MTVSRSVAGQARAGVSLRVATLPGHPAAWLLAILIIAFSLWFSCYSIRLHDAHLTHKADLGQMDIAIWNTAHGRFLQEIKGDSISTRLTDHVEPIFALIAPVFWIWDDVRALLILQAVCLALGAWPIYLLARRRLGAAGIGAAAPWSALAFGAAYLLVPALEAPLVSDFHALPLAVPLIGWAFWTIERRQWTRFVLAALLLASVQEGMALLTAMLGLYATARTLLARPGADSRPAAPGEPDTQARHWPGALSGAAVCLLGLAWFYVATFVIIPHFAAQAYGLQESPYAARFGELGSSFAGVLKTILTRPGLVLRTVAEPLRLRCLFGLLAPTAFLALLAPEVLFISLPLLLANLLSSFPLQYSGELHYSAPLVPYFVIAGAIGLARLLGWLRLSKAGLSDRHPNLPGAFQAVKLVTTVSVALMLAGALAYHAWAGYTPLGQEYWRRVAGGWPAVTTHDRLLARFIAQIPPAAALSTTPDLWPHLSHRVAIYQFPIVSGAQWVLVDVSGDTNRHPADVRTDLQGLMAGGWGVADAADGYVLLRKQAGAAVLPDAFYDFARVTGIYPQHALDITFGGKLRLLGYDVLDDVKWRRTGFRFYWQALAPLADGTEIALQVLAPDGSVVDDTAQRPMPALIWYPPARWRPGEIVVTEKAGWYLPAVWAPLLAVSADGAPLTPSIAPLDDPRTQANGNGGTAPGGDIANAVMTGDGKVRLPAWMRRDGVLVRWQAPEMLSAAGAQFSATTWAVRLDGYSVAQTAAPGASLPLILRWQAPGAAPASLDYTVFLHLRDAEGQTVANGDATPTWFTPRPTSTWGSQAAGSVILDAHTVSLPAGLAPGRYSLVAGLYDWQSGQRVPIRGPDGNVTGDEFVLGYVTIDAAASPHSDLACLMAREACVSQ